MPPDRYDWVKNSSEFLKGFAAMISDNQVADFIEKYEDGQTPDNLVWDSKAKAWVPIYKK